MQHRFMAVRTFAGVAALTIAVTSFTSTACDLKVESAWIREAPPNATTLAGYAVLKNTGTKDLHIKKIESSAFAAVEPHESITINGVATMRALDELIIAGHAQLEFAPQGKHFMLIAPQQAMRQGDVVVVNFTDASGCRNSANFMVRTAAASESNERDHATMDHSKMHHVGSAQ